MKEFDCRDCPFFWEVHYFDDADCGCELGLDGCDKHIILYHMCYLPGPFKDIAYKLFTLRENIRWWLYARKHEKEMRDE